ncbi:proline rich transmembrane protein 1B-like [Engraulis encrasicolus]|uniref:proline rich transmembrane protein 1B-like n=1 Tax=Engraulis encrasicolus TaxID=184585 RepID=UPI002FD216CB
MELKAGGRSPARSPTKAMPGEYGPPPPYAMGQQQQQQQQPCLVVYPSGTPGAAGGIYPGAYGSCSRAGSPVPSDGMVGQMTQVVVVQGGVGLSEPLPDYLIRSILTMLFCCFPCGLAALVYSINTRDANNTGNREMAEKNSAKARKLNNASIGCGITFIILYIIVSTIAAYNKL